LFVICCGFCWKLVLSHDYTWIDNPDIVQMDLPRLQFQRTAWHTGRFPLWDPHLWCGQPFLGQIVGAAFPVNWPLFLFPADASQKLSLDVLNWYFVLLHILAALAAYAFCRELGVSRLASVFGGFAYTFDGIIGSTLWPEVLGSLMLAPLIFLFLFRALRRHQPYGSAAMCGMFLGAAWLAGHHEVPIYLTLAVIGIWAFDFFRCAGKRRESFALAATTGFFAILTSGFQTVPGYEYARLAVRWAGLDHAVGWSEAIPYRIHESGSLPPSSIISMIVPWSGTSEAFLGIGVVALAAIAVVTAWRRRFVPLLVCIAVASLLFAMGGFTPLHGIAYSILPVFGKARIPMRMLAIFDLAIAVLAAVGLDSLASGVQSKAVDVVRRTLIAVGCIVLATALIARELTGPLPLDAFYVTAFCALGLAVLMSARQVGPLSARSLRLAVIGLVCFELANYIPGTFKERSTANPVVFQKLKQYQDIAEYLRKQPQPTRVNVEDEPFNFGDWEGIDMLTGFGAGVTANILGLEWPGIRTQNLLAVEYAVTKHAPRADQEVVFRGRSGVSVLKNRDALSRVRVVHRIEHAASIDEVHIRLGDPAFDGVHTAIMVAAPPALTECGGTENAAVVSRSANAVNIRAELTCRGMLVLAETWYPGWRVKVDGKYAPIYQPYAALRGVVLEAGTHRVEFRYRPASAWIGAISSLIGIFGACMVALVVARPRAAR
jgi:hypothetical protein